MQDMEQLKITIYKEFRRRQINDDFEPPWNGPEVLRQCTTDILAKEAKYSTVNASILYHDLLHLYYQEVQDPMSREVSEWRKKCKND